MKHSIKITALLICMFFLTQLIGIVIANSYYSNPNSTLPSWIDPPKDATPETTLSSIVIAIVIGVLLMLTLMRVKAEMFLRFWFFAVVTIAMSITLNILFVQFHTIMDHAFLIAFIVSLPLAYVKIFVRNIKVHNLTEMIIYPGVASLFIPLLNIWTVSILLVIISLYDMYAVWHSGFMQKMAKYQIQRLKFFSGFFVPYIGKKEKAMLAKSKSKSQNIKVNIAILGGGDVVFPIILAGVVLMQFGILSAIIIAIGATIALTGLFYMSEKGKFYPAMPFISAGCFAALAIVYLIN